MCHSSSAFRLRMACTPGCPGSSSGAGGPAPEPAPAAARAGPVDGAGGAAPTVDVRATTVQRMSIQRMVDLAGTLLSPDQAQGERRSGRRRPGRARRNRPGSQGRRPRWCKLEPRELQLALARAESALRQTRAQLGMTGPARGGRQSRRPTTRIASVSNAYATYLDAKATADRIHALAGRGVVSPSDQQAAETRLKVAEAAYQSAADTVRGQKALLQDRRAVVRPGAEEGQRRHRARPDFGDRLRPSGPGRRVHQRAHGRRDHRPGEPAEAPDRRPGEARRHHRARASRLSSASSRTATRCFTGRWPT